MVTVLVTADEMTRGSWRTYYIDAALSLALLSFTATLVAARYVTRGEPF